MAWSAFLLKSHPKLASALGAGELVPRDYTAKLPLDQRVYFQYYVQDDTEAGTLMDTKIPIKEVRNFDGRRWPVLRISWIFRTSILSTEGPFSLSRIN